MNSFLKTTQETKPAGKTGGILSRPAAAVALAGSLSVLTLAASLYLFMFAGRDLLPPPPIAGIPASRILEPVPMNSLSVLAPEIEVPPVPAVTALPVFLAANIPAAVETVAVPSDTTGTVAGVSVEPFPEDDDKEQDDNGRSSSHKEEQNKKKQNESRSISASNSGGASNSGNESKASRHKD